MDTSTIHRRRFAPGVLAGALLLVPLAACSEDTTTSGTATTETSAPAGDTGTTDTTAPEDTTATGTDAGVDCTGTSCSLTLTGDGAQADVLGTQVSLGTVQDGRATVRVGDREVSCSQGESVAAGPLTLECTTVTADAVTLTASLG
ncbi:hypothetical protein [Geodermatophilus poikilotrophus]|uniref:Uncharacterized protein n=1 Tax=Geodermatophilus poikilotrophus TaxID=1333667 RepID=A0A1H9ZEE2_9ACTN|nr:hypothetical protein [Geodermatophilus poikilotrophus]SES79944.1 hypothetical protein SAMN04488546_0549 [Geodermatophilus poikilotrophus]